MQTPDNGRFQQ